MDVGTVNIISQLRLSSISEPSRNVLKVTNNMMLRPTFLCLLIFWNYSSVQAEKLTDLVETTPTKFPFQVVILGRTYCGGVLINRHYVIAPAHCIDDSLNTKIYFGYNKHPKFSAESNYPSSTQIRSSLNIVIHEDFQKLADGYYLNNIALIKLSRPVEENNQISPAKLLLNQWETPLFGNVSGWLAQDLKKNMHFETVKLLNQDTCTNLFGYEFLPSQQICARSDSSIRLKIGNALSVNGQIMGFIIKRHTCKNEKSTCGNIHVFQNLVPYLSWIAHECKIPIEEWTSDDAGNRADSWD